MDQQELVKRVERLEAAVGELIEILQEEGSLRVDYKVAMRAYLQRASGEGK